MWMFQALKLSFILVLWATFFSKFGEVMFQLLVTLATFSIPISVQFIHVYILAHFDVNFLTLCQLHLIKSGSVHFYNEVKSPNSRIVKFFWHAFLARGLSIRTFLFGYMELELPTLISCTPSEGNIPAQPRGVPTPKICL
jgi:hypothetical protein